MKRAVFVSTAGKSQAEIVKAVVKQMRRAKLLKKRKTHERGKE